MFRKKLSDVFTKWAVSVHTQVGIPCPSTKHTTESMSSSGKKYSSNIMRDVTFPLKLIFDDGDYIAGEEDGGGDGGGDDGEDGRKDENAKKKQEIVP
jgi:hypothetical protein